MAKKQVQQREYTFEDLMNDGPVPELSAGYQAEQPEPEEVSAPDESGDFMRGMQNYIPQMKQMGNAIETLAGVGAKKIGLDGIGDSMIQDGLTGLNAAKSEIKSKGSDSFTKAWDDGIGTVVSDWLPYQMGQTVGNVGESLVAAGAGAALGAASTGPAAPAGAAGGLVGGIMFKSLLKKGVIEAAQAIAEKEGEQAARNFLKKQATALAGTSAAMATQAVYHGFGETGTRVLEEAQTNNLPLDQIDMGRYAASAAGHAALEFIGDKVLLGGVMGDQAYKAVGKGAIPFAKTVAGNIAKTGLKEMPVEMGQTALERTAAGLDLTSPEARNEYIDSAAAAGVMGVAGVPGATRAYLQNDPQAATAANLQDQIAKGGMLSRAATASRPDLQTAPLQGNPNGLPSDPAATDPIGPVDPAVDPTAGLGAGPGPDTGITPDAPGPLADDLGNVAGDANPPDATALGGEPGSPLVVGEPLDDEWTAFHPESGTLNVPREQMPQIKSEHRGAMVTFLKGKSIDTENDTVPAESLKPTQDKFAPAKVKQAAEFEGSDRPVLVSSDGHILDGHHQWLAKAMQEAPVKVIRLNAPITQLLTLMEQFPSAGKTKSTPAASTQSAPTGVTSLPTENTLEPQATITQQTAQEGSQAPADTGTVQVRQRRAQLTHMAQRGFTEMEERDGVTYMVNPKQKAEMPLGSSIDVALARQAVVAAGGTGDTVRQTTGVQPIGTDGVAPLRPAERGPESAVGAAALQGTGDFGQKGVERVITGNASRLTRSSASIQKYKDRLQSQLAAETNSQAASDIADELSQAPELGQPPAPAMQAFAVMANAWQNAMGGNIPVAYWDPRPTAVDGFEQNSQTHINLANPQMALQWTITHEADHEKEKEADPTEQWLRDLLWAEVTEEGRRIFFEGFKFPGKKYSQATPAQLQTLRHEIQAEFIGGRFTEKAWVEQLAQRKPHLFGRFIAEWIPTLTRTIAAIKSVVGIGQDSKKNVDKYMRNLVRAKAIAMEIAIGWAEKNQRMAAQTGAAAAVQHAKRAGADQWRPRDNFVVPEVDGAFVSNTGNIMTLPAFQITNKNGAALAYEAMPVRISIGQHKVSSQDQYGAQHRMDNALEKPMQRFYKTPYLEGGDAAKVERAVRDMAASILSASSIFADKKSPEFVVLHDRVSGHASVLQKTRDKQGAPYWSVKTVIPKSLEQMRFEYGHPTPIKGPMLDGVEPQQFNAIHRGILNKLREPGVDLSTSDSFILSDLGLIVNQAVNNDAEKTTPDVKTPQELAEAKARIRAKLFKPKEDQVKRSERVALQDDAQAQEQWLQREAQDHGYQDAEDMFTQDYKLFVALAKQWREQHPVEVMYSGREDLDLDFMAELQAELDAEMSGEEDGVTDAAIREHGLKAEDAFPDLAFEKKSGNLLVKIPDLYRDGHLGVIQLDSEADGLWGSQFNGTWIGPANIEKIGYATLKMAKAFARRFVASKDLRERLERLQHTRRCAPLPGGE